jgi:hypothetical protein
MTGNANRSKMQHAHKSIRVIAANDNGTHLEILSNFTDKPLEWELPDKQLSRLLVATDFTKSDGSGTETMGFLHSSSGSL